MTHGEAADLTRCKKQLAGEMGHRGVKPDQHEMAYMLLPDEVSGIVYLQHGFYIRAVLAPLTSILLT